MSRYLYPLLLAAFLWQGCARKADLPQTRAFEAVPFEKEESYIVHALFYKEHGEYAKAYALFDELYKKTGRPEYRLEAIRMLVAAKRYAEAEEELRTLLKKSPDDPELYRLATLVALRQKKVDKALENAKRAYDLAPDDRRSVDLLASVYLLKGSDEKAYGVYETYYGRHHDDATAVKMASILFHRLKRPQDAARLLETHSKMIGCGENVCLFLAELYRQNNDLDRLAEVYARLYGVTRSADFAKKAAEIYSYRKRFDKAEALLEESGADDRLLLAIYKHTRDFSRAAKLAQRLYEETSDPVWLAEYGILLYESAEKKNDPSLLKKVVAALREAFSQGVDDPLYYNYLGYLLIDHDIDPSWGVELVKKALKAEPDSAFYIDSLAWGYYKLGRCDEAYREMKKVVEKLGLKDEEIAAHWKKIQACRSRKK